MAKWVNLDDCVEISVGDMNFYPVELLGNIYEEVMPIIHAHWIEEHRNFMVCSNCGKYRGDWRTESFLYCPHCGVKMDEKVEE